MPQDLLEQLRELGPLLDAASAEVEESRSTESPRRRMALVAAAVLIVASIGAAALVASTRDQDPQALNTATPTSAPMEPSNRPLAETRWLLEEVRQPGEMTFQVTDGDTTRSVIFGRTTDANRMSFQFDDGCNTGGGTLRMEGNRMFPSNWTSTDAACASPSHEPFSIGDGGIPDSTTFTIDGDALILRGQDGRVLTYEADQRSATTTSTQAVTTTVAGATSSLPGLQPYPTAEETDSSRELAAVVVEALPGGNLRVLSTDTIGKGAARSDAAELATGNGARVTVVTAEDPGIDAALPAKGLYDQFTIEGTRAAFIREDKDQTKLVVFGQNDRLVTITAMASAEISSTDLTAVATAVLRADG